jgi:uncharacterized protein
MMGGSLDTNAILRWILGDIPSQQQTVDQLLEKKKTYHVADMAIQEVVYVMEKVVQMPRSLIVRSMQTIIAQANINCNRALLLKVLPYYSNHPAVSFTDCCLAVYAELNKTSPLMTFDKKLARQLPSVELLRED